MKKLSKLIIFLVIVGGACYWLAGHHIVTTPKGSVVLGKKYLTFKDTFADVRDWGSDEFDSHPQLKKALKEQGYGEILTDVRNREIKEGLGDAWDKVTDTAGRIGDNVQKTIDELGDSEKPDAPGNKEQSTE